jgi:hypothetical protein
MKILYELYLLVLQCVVVIKYVGSQSCGRSVLNVAKPNAFIRPGSFIAQNNEKAFEQAAFSELSMSQDEELTLYGLFEV